MCFKQKLPKESNHTPSGNLNFERLSAGSSFIKKLLTDSNFYKRWPAAGNP